MGNKTVFLIICTVFIINVLQRIKLAVFVEGR